MLSAERKLYILKKLESEQTIQVKQVAKELHVSESSIRRDLLELDDENKVDRIYGGAVKKERERILTDEAEIKMMERMSIHYDKKLRICKAASTLVEDLSLIHIYPNTVPSYCTIQPDRSSSPTPSPLCTDWRTDFHFHQHSDYNNMRLPGNPWYTNGSAPRHHPPSES